VRSVRCARKLRRAEINKSFLLENLFSIARADGIGEKKFSRENVEEQTPPQPDDPADEIAR
jgi:hypothetical protein